MILVTYIKNLIFMDILVCYEAIQMLLAGCLVLLGTTSTNIAEIPKGHDSYAYNIN